MKTLGQAAQEMIRRQNRGSGGGVPRLPPSDAMLPRGQEGCQGLNPVAARYLESFPVHGERRAQWGLCGLTLFQDPQEGRRGSPENEFPGLKEKLEAGRGFVTLTEDRSPWKYPRGTN